MKKAEYPQKTCRDGIMTESGLGYTCDLPLNHAGPCATLSNKDSTERRDRWEADNPELATAVSDLDVIIGDSRIEGSKQHTYPPAS